jgi:hypothetical protein
LHAPLSALVEPTSNTEGFVQKDSIMNVDILERLGREDDTPISVCLPEHENQVMVIQRSVLAALTAELTFALANEPAQPIFNEVDLLDFPGYRGRLELESFNDLSAAGGRQHNPITQLFLRGKVAYLFERYTDSQEMNVLVVCAASHKQSDVADVGPVLSSWIDRTQGETAEKRAHRPSGLIWAITMFDMKIADSLSKDESMLEMVWDNLIKMTMLERFQQYAWMQNWRPGNPFDTTFLVRKPRLPVTFLTLENDTELAIAPNSVNALGLMQQTFCRNALVQQHVRNPQDAFESMLALNDGGISRLSTYLGQVAVRDHKLSRISEQLDELLHDLIEGRLGPWFQHEGADEIMARKRSAEMVINALKPRARLIGELQQALLPSDDVLQSLYMSSEFEAPSAAQSPQSQETSGAALDLGDDFIFDEPLDLFGDQPPKSMPSTKEPSLNSSDARYARAVIRQWIEHLRSLPENSRLVSYLGVPKRALEQLTDELITSITRLDLQDALLDRVAQTEEVGTKRERLVSRQVLASTTLLGDFLVWLGQHNIPMDQREHSRLHADAKLFQPPVRPRASLPALSEQPSDYGRTYLADWLVSLAKLILENAGHDAGREISIELNARLGEILRHLKAAQVGAA